MASSYKEISFSDLKSFLEKGSGLLVDVRSKDECKFGVPKPSPDSSELIFHCQMGRRGDVATDKARSLGFKNARNYAGGYKEWSEKEGK